METSTNLSNFSTPSPPAVVDRSREFVFYSLSVIIPFGLICNTLSIVIFMSKSLRPRAASWYLAALALSDDASLLTIMVDYWLKDTRIGLPIILSSNVLCITVTYLSHASRLLSAWLVMSFTIERFIGVVFPLKRAALSSTSHARRVITGEMIACFTVTSFCLFTIGVEDMSYGKECDVLPSVAQYYLVFNTVFLVFGSIVIPIITICTLNMFILYKVYQRKVIFTPQNTRFNGEARLTSTQSNRDFNIATLLLVVSSSFVILNAPYCICWFILFFNHHNIGVASSSGGIQWHLFAAKYITSVPYYLNYSINFALYSLCARAFRAGVVQMFACRSCCGIFSRDRRFSDSRQTVIEHLCLENRASRSECKPDQSTANITDKKLANGTQSRMVDTGKTGEGPCSDSSEYGRLAPAERLDEPLDPTKHHYASMEAVMTNHQLVSV